MKNGFTLIELLVTISIIAILMAISIASYDNLTKNARDSQRKSDLKQIQSALEQYYRDNTSYPLSLPAPSWSPYLNQVPTEAVDTTNHPYLYIPLYVSATSANATGCDNVSNNCTKYCLFAEMENSSNNNLVTECPNTISGASTYHYSVSSP
ncbi:prepilin-type N-terminal cleavage/methylation domain-containing protein [Candidatus Daviesbacteria bacterium]|nr:prepilin-type N-terminal cleavage/methylation domain-containing protein [Candidatus Daviesbacteria bacterium]